MSVEGGIQGCEKVRDWDGPESQTGGVVVTLLATAFHSMAQHSIRVLQERRTGATRGREVTVVIADHRQGSGLQAGATWLQYLTDLSSLKKQIHICKVLIIWPLTPSRP